MEKNTIHFHGIIYSYACSIRFSNYSYFRLDSAPSYSNYRFNVWTNIQRYNVLKQSLVVLSLMKLEDMHGKSCPCIFNDKVTVWMSVQLAQLVERPHRMREESPSPCEVLLGCRTVCVL